MYLHMSDKKPYGEAYYAELDRLYEAQKMAAQRYTAQMMYLRLGGKYDHDTRRTTRERVAEEAAQEWIRLNIEIEALQSAEYDKKRAAEGVEPPADWERCDLDCCRYVVR